LSRYRVKVARRPEHADREAWLAERDRVWKRRNRWLNVLMLVTIVLIVARTCL
jgi:hypothetical protein